VAERVENAWLATLESGIHTADLYRPGLSAREVGTEAFTQAVIDRIGEEPRQLRAIRYVQGGIDIRLSEPKPVSRELVGVDVFLNWDEHGREANRLGRELEAATPAGWSLRLITNRGVKVYPDGFPETFRTDHWRCRFLTADGRKPRFEDVLEMLRAVHGAGLEIIKTEHLYNFDGSPGYSLGQGE
jgi:isocitrate dehydrogenase